MFESRIERRLKNEVERRGGKALKFTPQGYAGMPDRIILIPGGKTVFVELKAPGKKPRPLQVKRARELHTLGFRVYLIDSIESINSFIKEVMSR